MKRLVFPLAAAVLLCPAIVLTRGPATPNALVAKAEPDPKQDADAKEAGGETVAKTIDATSAARDVYRDARKLRRFVKADWVMRFLKASKGLPEIAPRTLYRDAKGEQCYAEHELGSLDQSERDGLAPRVRDGHFYYSTKHGTPIAYARAFDVLAAEGFELKPGCKVLDYGYGSIGQLLLLARLGADTVGIEVDPELRALYSYPGDQGEVDAADGTKGSIRLVHGHWPKEREVCDAVGGGYDLFVSKNVLKRGYVHPEHDHGGRNMLDYGVDDRGYVQTLFDILNPGGYVLIYNICPAQAKAGEKYIPWADGRSPYSRELYESIGFEVLVFDRKDDAATRKMATLLGWNAAPFNMDVENNLFAWYTIVRKPADAAKPGV